MFKKQIVIDGKGHMMGRLASYVAKQLLSGKAILIQEKESLSSDASQSTCQDLSSETKSNSTNSLTKDS
jgi:hypothetical protein